MPHPSLPPFLRPPRGMPPGGPRSPRFGPPRSPFRPGMIRGPPGSRPPFPFRGPPPFRGRSPSPTSSAAGSRKSSFDGPLGRPPLFEKVSTRRPSNSLPPLGENPNDSSYETHETNPTPYSVDRGIGHHSSLTVGLEEEVSNLDYEMSGLPPPMPTASKARGQDQGYSDSPTASIEGCQQLGSAANAILENTDQQAATTTQHNDSLSNWVKKLSTYLN